MALNNVNLMGRLVRDPELQHTSGNVSYLKFTVAVDRDYTDPNGNRGTDFINCSAWRSTAEFVNKYFRKGDNMAVTGRLTINKWKDREGNNHNDPVIDVSSVYFAGKRSSDSATSAPAKQTFTDLGDDESGLPWNDSTDDLPFTVGAAEYGGDKLPL